MKNIQIIKTELLSDDWYTLKKITFSGTLNNGTTVTQDREAYHRGDGAVILLYNKKQGTVILTRQFRLVTYINGNEDGMLIECCAGLLDNDNAEECIRRETEEETGYKISSVQKIFELYTCPGSVTENMYFFIAEYESNMKVNEGGGSDHEQEDIEVMEMTFANALNMIKTGEIRDAKTVILLQYALINNLMS